MSIVFDEVTADIAPPAAAAEAPPATAPAAAGDVDAQSQLRRSLALLLEREARLVTD